MSERGGGSLGDDSVRAYLNEIGLHPLLTGDEEVQLAQRMEAAPVAEAAAAAIEVIDGDVIVTEALGSWAVDEGLSEQTTLTADMDGLPDEMEDLIGEIYSRQQEEQEARRNAEREAERLRGDADDARRTMIQSNLRLVVSIAKRYQGNGMELLDLVQEGNVGLMTAIEKFDWRKGFKVSTYATWWIRQAITRSLADKGRTIRIPVHMVDSLNALQRARAQLSAEKKEVTLASLAEQTGWTEDAVQKVEDARRMSEDPLSLSNPVGEDGDSEFGDFIADPNAVPDEDAARTVRIEAITKILAEMDSERERDVIKMRFGIGDNEPHTLDEVGRKFNVTRERIRQIESKALDKLRANQDAKRLREE